MTNAQLQSFRDLAETMNPAPKGWQWIGVHMSQQMFGITQDRAESMASRFGGRAEPMPIFSGEVVR